MGVYVVHKGISFHIDNVAMHKHDHNFTTSAFDKDIEILREKGIKLGENITTLIVWSDGGLKTKENLYYFLLLAKKYKIKVMVNFFAPYHGHSEVSAHSPLQEDEKNNSHTY
jgi:hypothetical protein